jgi:hypothetical protein
LIRRALRGHPNSPFEKPDSRERDPEKWRMISFATSVEGVRAEITLKRGDEITIQFHRIGS